MSDDDVVVQHYENTEEHERIVRGLGQLELVRTREILRRFLPDPPARVLDIGGGTGVHAAWLADEDYQVHLVDLTPRHVAVVQEELGTRGVTAEVGDARSLTQPDGAYDVALLLGPLYHLTDRADRVRALTEAARVVRHDGLVAAAGITRFASLFDGLARDFLLDARFKMIVERDLRDGQHRNPTNEPHWFTTAFFHHPDELERETKDAGLAVIALLGIEGLAGWLPQLATLWSTDEGRDTILDAVRATESEASLRGLSAHMLIVGRVRD
jgi:2-polyprenyl-3-methyl-5-hydroxy-6-metoxy-1,4-benzoquinol methylase